MQPRDPPDRLDHMLDLVRRHVPDLKLVDKRRVPWMRAIGAAVAPVVPEFQDRFTTVIGSTVYLPRAPEEMPRDALAATLAHELVHQLDQRKYGAGFYASYAFALPLGRTARAHWERRAYAVDLMLALSTGGEAALRRVEARLVELFSGPAYGWMWAGQAAARQYLAPIVTSVRAGTLQQGAPYADILAAWECR